MPLYNQATTLNTGRGNFAPSVTYYAGIKAPDQPAVHLPRQNASFNIDLRPIGDAIIRTQELEIKKQDAEAERAFRQSLADQEDKRYRDLEALRDAREREFHTDDYNQRQRQLEIDEYKALSNYDIELRKLLREEEKDKKDNDKKLANTLITKADEFIRKAYLRMEQDPSYTREKAQDDVYNYISNIESYYPDIVDPAKLADTASRYTFGFGGSKKAAEEAQYNEANALENQFQAAKEQVPGLRNRPDPQARKMYQDTVTQIDTFQRYKKIVNNPYTSLQQKEIAFSEMQNAGINMARLGTLNKIYEFATKEVRPGDYTNYTILEASLRNSVVNSLASSMEYKDAQDYYNIAKERMGVNAFLESYNQYHKTNAEETDNIATDMLNTINGEYLFTIPAWRAYKALGGNVNSIVQTDPLFAKNLGNQILGIVKSNGVTYNENTKTYTYQNKEYTTADVIEAQRLYGVSDPYSAVTLAAVAEAKNMPTMVEQGLATDENVNDSIDAEFSLVLKPGQISTSEDATVVLNNLRSSGFRENLLWCRKRTGTKDGTRRCMTAVGVEKQLDDSLLTDYTRALSNTKSSFGFPDPIGIKLTSGNGIELGFIDNRINISDDNFKVLNRLVNRLNSSHSDVSQDAKIAHLRLYDGLANIPVLDSSYTGPFLTKPSETQKDYGKVFEMDKNISEGYSEVTNKLEDTVEVWVNAATNKKANIKRTPKENWIDEDWNGTPYSYSWNGEFLNIQFGDDLLVVKTSASPEQVLSDYMNDPETLKDYEYIRHYKRLQQ
jgi:hypothetical protein